MEGMFQKIPIGETSGRLSELLRDLGPHDQIGLTENGRLVARILPEAPLLLERLPGACKDLLDILDDGDDAVLDQFEAYLP
jgi:antitoxin (DNA-binding transcriptional repressor) of toxin-antitoxin stability system